MENVVNNGPVSEEQADASRPELKINDLLQVRALVELSVRRGAFQANEMTAVGAIYDRLNNFLNAVAPPAPPQTDETVNNNEATLA